MLLFFIVMYYLDLMCLPSFVYFDNIFKCLADDLSLDAFGPNDLFSRSSILFLCWIGYHYDRDRTKAELQRGCIEKPFDRIRLGVERT